MKPRILVVEDEAAIADTIVYALATDDFEPQWCATGSACIDTRPARTVTIAMTMATIGRRTKKAATTTARRFN